MLNVFIAPPFVSFRVFLGVADFFSILFRYFLYAIFTFGRNTFDSVFFVSVKKLFWLFYIAFCADVIQDVTA